MNIVKKIAVLLAATVCASATTMVRVGLDMRDIAPWTNPSGCIITATDASSASANGVHCRNHESGDAGFSYHASATANYHVLSIRQGSTNLHPLFGSSYAEAQFIDYLTFSSAETIPLRVSFTLSFSGYKLRATRAYSKLFATINDISEEILDYSEFAFTRTYTTDAYQTNTAIPLSVWIKAEGYQDYTSSDLTAELLSVSAEDLNGNPVNAPFAWASDAAVPEPATSTMMVAALAVTFTIRRRWMGRTNKQYTARSAMHW